MWHLGSWCCGELGNTEKIEFDDPRGLCQPKKFDGFRTLTNWPHCYPKVWAISVFSETVIQWKNWKEFNSYTCCVGLHSAGLDSWFWFAKTAASECFSLSKPCVAAPKLAQWFWGLASHASTSYFMQDFCRPSFRLITEHHADKLHFKNFFVNDAQVTVSKLPTLHISLHLRTGSHSLLQVEFVVWGPPWHSFGVWLCKTVHNTLFLYFEAICRLSFQWSIIGVVLVLN